MLIAAGVRHPDLASAGVVLERLCATSVHDLIVMKWVICRNKEQICSLSSSTPRAAQSRAHGTPSAHVRPQSLPPLRLLPPDGYPTGSTGKVGTGRGRPVGAREGLDDHGSLLRAQVRATGAAKVLEALDRRRQAPDDDALGGEKCG